MGTAVLLVTGFVFLVIAVYVAYRSLRVPIPQGAIRAEADVDGESVVVYVRADSGFLMVGLILDAALDAAGALLYAAKGTGLANDVRWATSQFVVHALGGGDFERAARENNLGPGARAFYVPRSSFFGANVVPTLYVRYDLGLSVFKKLVIHELLHAAKGRRGEMDHAHADRSTFGVSSGIEGEAIRALADVSEDDELTWRESIAESLH